MTNKNVKAPCFMIVLDTACPREEIARCKGFYRATASIVAGGVLRRVDYVWRDADGHELSGTQLTEVTCREEQKT